MSNLTPALRLILRRMFLALLISLPAAETGAGQEIHIRGTLVWTNATQTITECSSGRVYYVRVLASNPYDALSRKVEELVANGADSILAEFRAEIISGTSSSIPVSPVDGTLSVQQISAVAPGRCGS